MIYVSGSKASKVKLLLVRSRRQFMEVFNGSRKNCYPFLVLCGLEHLQEKKNIQVSCQTIRFPHPLHANGHTAHSIIRVECFNKMQCGKRIMILVFAVNSYASCSNRIFHKNHPDKMKQFFAKLNLRSQYFCRSVLTYISSVTHSSLQK